ncbi:metallophosphoesterase family protein [Thalassobacillus hwangdonensis]|uniref:Phosphoesterase n=1 Tax=Thalassobacillus hwangdonensis TaxID=546108 RepID=A0ABW3L3J1_9BACI
MKVVVLSDTHMPTKAKQLPVRLLEELKTAELILHAGDWQSLNVYDTLSTFAEVKGVTGNVDGNDMKEKFPEQQIIEVGKYRIGLVHGHGEKKTTEKRAIEAFEDTEVDIIVYGHSHIPVTRYFKKTLLFNPGSPTDKRALPYYSFGILHLGEELKAEHIFFQH